jgi:hypothetical protein
MIENLRAQNAFYSLICDPLFGFASAITNCDAAGNSMRPSPSNFYHLARRRQRQKWHFPCAAGQTFQRGAEFYLARLEFNLRVPSCQPPNQQ